MGHVAHWQSSPTTGGLVLGSNPSVITNGPYSQWMCAGITNQFRWFDSVRDYKKVWIFQKLFLPSQRSLNYGGMAELVDASDLNLFCVPKIFI